MTSQPDGSANPLLDISSLEVGPVEVEASDAELPIPAPVIADLFTTLDKAVRSQRLYQSNNPVYHSFVQAAHQAFANLWDQLPSLTAGVEEHAFRWYGRAFPAGEARENLTFLFYKDGIRFITFLPGFEEELEKFLDIVNRARSLDQRSDDDMVTLLWQAELMSFQYSYIDALAEGLQLPQPPTIRVQGIDLTLRDAAIEGTDPTEVRPPAVEAGEPPVASLVSRDDFSETLYFLEPSELELLRREVELEWARDLRKDVLDALFDRLEDLDLEWRSEILRILRQLLPVYLGAGELRAATQIIVELNAIVERGVLSEQHREDATALFRELSEPAVLAQLLRSLEEGRIDPQGAELGIFLKHLGPSAMPVLLAAIERSGVAALQARLRQSMEELGRAHQPQLVALLDDSDADVVRGAARLAGQLGIAGAAPKLVALLQRMDPTVRRTAVEALVLTRSSIAMEALQRSLADDDRDVRIAAARGLASLRYAPARERLAELVESRLVRDADLTEKLAFFEAYGAAAAADGVALLDRILNGRRLLAKESPEMRACAALVLGRINSTAARESLQRSANETNPIVRNAVMKALRAEGAR